MIYYKAIHKNTIRIISDKGVWGNLVNGKLFQAM